MTKQTVEINRELASKILTLVDKGLCKGLGQPVEGQMGIEAVVNYAMGLPHGDHPPCVSRALRMLKIRLNDSSAWSSNAARAAGMRRLAIAQLGTAGQLNDIEFVKAVAAMTIQKIVPRAFRSAARIAGKVMRVLLEEWAQKIEKEPTKEMCRAAADAVYAADEAADEAADAAAKAAVYAAANAAVYAADEAADEAADAAADAVYAVYAAKATDAVKAAIEATDAADAPAKAVYAAKAAAKAAKDKELSFFAEEVVQILITMKAPGTEWLDLTEAA